MRYLLNLCRRSQCADRRQGRHELAFELTAHAVEVGLGSQHCEAITLAVQTRQYLAGFNEFTFFNEKLYDFASSAGEDRCVGIGLDGRGCMVSREDIAADGYRHFDGYGRGSAYFGFEGSAGLTGTAAGEYCDADQGQNGECWVQCFHSSAVCGVALVL